MNARKITGIFFVAALLGACGRSQGGNNDGSEVPLGEVPQSAKGTWRTECKTFGTNDFFVSGTNTAFFDGAQFVVTGKNFKSKDCSDGALTTMKWIFSFQILSRSLLGPNIFDVNATGQKITFIISDQDTANAMNTSAFCGFTDWIVGVEKEITDTSCMSGPKANETVYTIMKLTDLELQLGEPDATHDGKTPEQRHVQLGSQKFMKVNESEIF